MRRRGEKASRVALKLESVATFWAYSFIKGVQQNSMAAASLHRQKCYKLDQSSCAEFKKCFSRLDGLKLKKEDTFLST